MRVWIMGISLVGLVACNGKTVDPEPVDADRDGYTEEADCNDNDGDIHPGADELCDEVDNDCDGDVDEEAVDMATFYADTDGDLYGDAQSSITACAQEEGYVSDNTDCDDTAEAVNPGANEICDAEQTDEDCDGLADDEDDSTDSSTMITWYIDVDQDGFGDLSDTGILACLDPSDETSWYTKDNTDCNDMDPDAWPGAEEVFDDGIDQDCDGEDMMSEFFGHLDLWDGSSYGDTSPGQCLTTPITIGRDLTITHIGAAVRIDDETNDLFHLTLHKDTSGEPDALLASVDSTTLKTGINEVALSEPLKLSAGTVWTGICNDKNYANGYHIRDTTIAIAYEEFSSTPPDPFPAASRSFSVQIIVWVVGY